MVAVTRTATADGIRPAAHGAYALEQRRLQAPCDGTKRPRVVVPPLSFAGLKVASRAIGDEETPAALAAAMAAVAKITPREYQRGVQKGGAGANHEASNAVVADSASARATAPLPRLAAAAESGSGSRTAASEASSEDLSVTPGVSARKPHIPMLCLSGVRESLQGCLTVGARPPEELVQIHSSGRASNASEERLSARAPSSASSATTDHDDPQHKDTAAVAAVPVEYPKWRTQVVPKLSLHTLRKSPRGLRQSPTSLRHSPLGTAEDTIPEEVGHQSTSSTATLHQDTQSSTPVAHDPVVGEDAADPQVGVATQWHTSDRLGSARRGHKPAVPRLHLGGLRPSAHGTALLGIVPPEEPVLSSKGSSPTKRHGSAAMRALRACSTGRTQVCLQRAANQEDSSAGGASSEPASQRRAATGRFAVAFADGSAQLPQLSRKEQPYEEVADAPARLWWPSLSPRVHVSRCFEFLLRASPRPLASYAY
mmetsp:Transcript_45772/g.83868  ORF Transcript_45772/g.83868 Transcript_45772/m.83868 type:complete len:483 (+) Transcript_45772:90-1538(+)